MTQKSDLNNDDSAWELPSFDEALYGGKRHDHALVIPVINEGERIRGQLQRIKDAGHPVDVIIANGGSTDGSLESDFLKQVGVRARLTKTGPGKLSAQLRMAYAWALRQGYQGILTVDGNGKDGMEAIPLFLDKLGEGYDYVQGSRYHPDGVHENTPLERALANRLIHAPMLSLAGRKRLTDTTNGYRAYSARYLRDPRVQPFRDVFVNYELLFYLTVRAGQLGFRVTEVPVVRRYPGTGKTPTKIAGFVGKLRMLGQTADVATGGYVPDRFASLRYTWLVPTAFLLITVALFYSRVTYPAFSPDSWAFYELSKTVFGDFYRFTHFRSFWSDSPYSSSFPPLFPVLIALLDEIIEAGARTQYFLGFLSFAVFAVLAEYSLRKRFDIPFVGLGVALLLAGTTLAGELTGGRSIPLQLAIYSLLLLMILQWEKFGFLGCVTIGAVSGLAILNRFDAVFLPPLLAVAHVMLLRRPRQSIAILFGALVVVLPWIYYSLSTFGVVFVTDNSSVATSIDPRAFVTDWWPEPQPSASDDIGAWLSKTLRNLYWLGDAAIFTLLRKELLLAAIVYMVPVVGLIALIGIGRGRLPKMTPTANMHLASSAAFLVIMGAILLPQALSGYYDIRYFSALYFAMFVFLFGTISHTARSRQQRYLISTAFFVLCAVLSAVYSAVALVRNAPGEGMTWASFGNPPVLDQLSACMGEDVSSRLLVIGNNNLAARLGAQGGFSTLMEPRNMESGRLGPIESQEFLSHWGLGFVLVDREDRLDWTHATFDLQRVPDCPLLLYSVEPNGSVVGAQD